MAHPQDIASHEASMAAGYRSPAVANANANALPASDLGVLGLQRFPLLHRDGGSLLLLFASVVMLFLFLRHQHQRQQQRHTQKQSLARRRMSGMGLTTLISETETNLSIPISLLTLHGHLSPTQLAARLQERMAQDPFFLRFRSLVANASETPMFQEQTDFEATRHISTYELGKDESALTALEALVNTPLSMDKPLWEIAVLQQHQDPPQGTLASSSEAVTHLIWRVHHCLGDGASLAASIIRLCDHQQVSATTAPAPPTKTTTTTTTSPQPDKQVSLATSAVAALQSAWGMALLALWSLYVVTRKLLALLWRREPITVFRRQGGTHKQLAYGMRYSVAATKAVGKRVGGATINDVMLCCVAGAMQRAMLLHAASKACALPRVVRAAIPVDLRAARERIRLPRNKFSSLLLDLPVGERDPLRRLQLIQSGMREAKDSWEKLFTFAGSQLLAATLPRWLVKAAVGWMSARVTVAVSNMRIPVSGEHKAALCGATVDGLYAFVPPPPSVNLGIVILSVGDELGLNVNVDANVGVDAQQFLELAKEEFDLLQEAVAQVEEKEKKVVDGNEAKKKDQ